MFRRVGAGGLVQAVLDGDSTVAAGLASGDDMAVGGTLCSKLLVAVVGVDETEVHRGGVEGDHDRRLRQTHHLDPASRHVLFAWVFHHGEERLDCWAEAGVSVEPFAGPEVAVLAGGGLDLDEGTCFLCSGRPRCYVPVQKEAMTVLVSPPRDELDDATLVVHMGAGAIDSVTAAAVRNYRQYASFRPPGLLTVSVFAAEGGVTVQEIVDAMPHGKFGTTSIRQVLNQGFEMIKTYITGTPLEPRLMEVHYDIILNIGTWLPSIVDGQPSEEDVESVEHLIRDESARLMALFEPRKER